MYAIRSHYGVAAERLDAEPQAAELFQLLRCRGSGVRQRVGYDFPSEVDPIATPGDRLDRRRGRPRIDGDGVALALQVLDARTQTRLLLV